MMNIIKLNDLARKINQRESQIEVLKKQTIDRANAAVCEALLQGQDLLAAKAMCKHGEWLDWVGAHCPALSVGTINRYMRLASVYSTNKKLIEAESLRAALLLCSEDKPETEATQQPRTWPAFQEGMGKAWKFVEYVKRHPLGQWPGDTLAALREDLEPVAAELWPDRFGRAAA